MGMLDAMTPEMAALLTRGVWVLADMRSPQSVHGALALMTPANALAQKVGAPVCALILTEASDDAAASAQTLARALIEAGAQGVTTLADPLLTSMQPRLTPAALARLLEACPPRWLLTTHAGPACDYAPRAAMIANVRLVPNVTDIAFSPDGAVLVSQSCFGDAWRAERLFLDDPTVSTILTARPRSFEAPTPDPAREAPVLRLALDLDAAASTCRLVSRQTVANERPPLGDADIVVTGGRGLQSAERFAELVEPLADALGAAIGASRAVVDAGWRPHREQVGQTGKTVRPRLYVAMAVSGALQHLVGMRDSQTIVAINRDPDAPIFKAADLAVVGDAFTLAPALTQALKRL